MSSTEANRIIQSILLGDYTFLSEAICPADQDLIEKSYLDHQSHYVPYKIPQPTSILRSLSTDYYPTLPVSYFWNIMDDHKPILYRHEYSLDHNYELVLYDYDPFDPTETQSFLSCWDGVTYQGFALTRNPGFDDKRYFPIEQDDYTYEGKHLERGHIIDHKDTVGFYNLEVRLPSDLLSTFDPRNFKPEPLNSHWAGILRRDLVGNLRKNGGAYMEYLYYPLEPLRTRNGTQIPKGVYFCSMDIQGGARETYHVPWDHPVHNFKGEGQRESKLLELKCHKNFIPSPFVASKEPSFKDIVSSIKPQLTNLPSTQLCLKTKDFSFYEKYLLEKQASHEFLSIIYKIHYLSHLMSNNVNNKIIASWLIRLATHAENLQDHFPALEILPTDSYNVLMEQLRSVVGLNRSEEYEDHIDQIYKNQTEEKIRIDTLYREPFDLSKWSASQVYKIQMPCFETGSLKNFKYPKIPQILETLKTSSEIGIRGLTIRKTNQLIKAIQMSAIHASRIRIHYSMESPRNSIFKAFRKGRISAEEKEDSYFDLIKNTCLLRFFPYLKNLRYSRCN